MPGFKCLSWNVFVVTLLMILQNNIAGNRWRSVKGPAVGMIYRVGNVSDVLTHGRVVR